MQLLRTLIPGRVKSYIHAQRCRAKGKEEIRCLSVLCDRTRDSLDIGANGGNYTYFILKHSRFVHSFEPIAGLVEHLRRRFPSRVAVYHMALSSKSGAAELSIPVVDGRQLFGLSSLNFGGGDGTELLAHERVSLRRLDEVFSGDAGFIKIDVEGHEVEVLEGARQTIAHCRPVMLIEASERQYPGSVGRLKRMIDDLGYRGWFVQGGRLIPMHDHVSSADGPAKLIQLADRHYLATHEKYVSNFICLPRERAGDLARRLRAVLNGH